MRPYPIGETESLTFSDYFKLNAELDEVLASFGFDFEARACDLPRSDRPFDRLLDLKARLAETLPHLSLTGETARREFLIAPVLMELIHYTGGRIRVEYPLAVDARLQGTLDYLIEVKNRLLVIEAKNADLARGFTQLAVELIALDRWCDPSQPLLYGAISIGEIWQFGILDRAAKRVTQDLNLYRVPADLEPLMRVLVGILAG